MFMVLFASTRARQQQSGSTQKIASATSMIIKYTFGTSKPDWMMIFSMFPLCYTAHIYHIYDNAQGLGRCGKNMKQLVDMSSL